MLPAPDGKFGYLVCNIFRQRFGEALYQQEEMATSLPQSEICRSEALYDTVKVIDESISYH